MPRTSRVHYIAPSAISITPNANNSANDLAVYIANGAKIKVYSQGIGRLGVNPSTNSYREWTIGGRNRRLNGGDGPYTIYARLQKREVYVTNAKAYLVFAAKYQYANDNPYGLAGQWFDAHSYVLEYGLSAQYDNRGFPRTVDDPDYWWVKLGEVSEVVNGERTVTSDTGILGTDQYNTGWRLDPDALPTRVEVENSYGTDIPRVLFDDSIIVIPKLIEGFNNDVSHRVAYWTVTRNTGDANADKQWSAGDTDSSSSASSDSSSESVGHIITDSGIQLRHMISGTDDFNRAASATFTFTAWGEAERDSSSSSSSSSDSSSSDSSSSGGISPIASGSITILAEVAEPRDRTYSEWVQGKKYYYRTINPERDPETGRVYVETSFVYNRYKLWMCLDTGTSEEPKWNCENWKVVSGNTVYVGQILTSNGARFRNGNVDTILTMQVWWGDEDITDLVAANHGYQITWKRYTQYNSTTREYEQRSEDYSWTPTAVQGEPSIVLTRNDMGSEWMRDYRSALVKCIVSADGIDNLESNFYL